MIAPIQTWYKGYHFRSRLEARWAVFFDAMGLKWQYEPEGYDLGAAGWYLPDFRVEYPGHYADDRHNWWIEVKPEAPIEDDPRHLAFAGQVDDLILVYGDPDARPYIMYEHSAASRVDILLWSSKNRIWFSPSDDDLGYCKEDGFYMQAVRAARSARFEHGEQPHIAQPAPPPLATHTIAALGAAPAGQIGVIAGKLVNPVVLPVEQQGTVLRAGFFDVTGWARLKVPAAVYEATRSLWSPGQRVLLTGRLIPHDGDFAGALLLSDQPAKQLAHTILEVLRVQELPA